MSLHSTTFGFVEPTEDQKGKLAQLRAAAKKYADFLERELPEGPDKTFVLRNHRTTSMWALVAITRNDDGSPREDLA